MHITALLKEEMAPANNLRFSDLSTQQVRTLMRLASGEVDFETVDEREMRTLDELQDLGLLDNAYELTRIGSAAARVAQDKGGVSGELEDARQRAEMNPSPEFDGIGADDTDDLGLDGEAEDELEAEEFNFKI